MSTTEPQEGLSPPRRQSTHEEQLPVVSGAAPRSSPVPPQITETRVPLMRNASPWQRSYAVWQAAGVDWANTGTEPQTVTKTASKRTARKDAARGRKAAATSATTTASESATQPAVQAVGTPAARTGTKPATKPAAKTPPGTAPRPAGTSQAAASKAAASRAAASRAAVSETASEAGESSGRSGSRLRAGRVVPIAVAVVLVAGGGAYVLLSGHEKHVPKGPVAAPADRIFALDPAATADGRVQKLTGVAAAGSTVVAIGSEQGDAPRSRFVTSVDGGRSWRVAEVRAADGEEPAPGQVPERITGGRSGWLALGGTAVWTSRDGHVWTRRPDVPASVFGPSDQVNAMARTASGFVAVGTTGPAGKTQGVVWTTPDGRIWQRIGADQLNLGAVIAVDRVAAQGNILVVRGTVAQTVTRTVKKNGKTSKVSTTTQSGAFWRSADGGRSWAGVNIPQPQGALPAPARLVTGPGGFFIVREVARPVGPKKHQKTVRSAAVLSSPDGTTWAETGQITQNDYAEIDRFGGSDSGLAALVKTTGGTPAVLRSADGRTWQRLADGTLSAAQAKNLTGLAVLPSATVVVGRQGAGDAYLSALGGAGDVDLTKIPNMIHPDRTIAALAASGSQIVAVGGGNGDAAVWVTQDGKSWQRAQTPHGAGPRQLSGVAHGSAGWVAVGHSGGGSAPDGTTVPARPVVLTSADGAGWQAAGGFPTGDGILPSAVTYGPDGYVAVGRAGTKAAAWRSADLKTWQPAGGDLGDGRWMTGVTVTPTGYLAVGGRQVDPKTVQPAVWTSADGKKKWTAVASPPLPYGVGAGAFTEVMARGGVLVAAGSATVGTQPQAFSATSADGGRTWQPQLLPGGGDYTTATLTTKGFLVAAAAGAPGRTDVELWVSVDGRTWRRIKPHGAGLDGRGAQRLTAVTAIGTDLLAVGVNGDYRGDTPTLWRAPTP